MNQNQSKKTKILITGANGFVGKQLIKSLLDQGTYFIHAASRHKDKVLKHDDIDVFEIQQVGKETNWHEALQDCHCVVHTAARVHIMKDDSLNPLAEYRQVNVEGSINIAKQAIQHGVKRFIYLSSIKVNGDKTSNNKSFTAEDSPNPLDPYALSKHEAEESLKNLCKNTSMELVIIRPPLVYGPQAKGNFALMVHMIKKGYPLPLKNINNKRSMVSIYNLVSMIERCLVHPNINNQTFLISDNNDLSTSELIIKIGQVLNKRVLLFSIPYIFLNTVAKMIGKKAIVDRLYDSLQIDMSKTQSLLGWYPVVTVDQALDATLADPKPMEQ